jgi:hypothetical protein
MPGKYGQASIHKVLDPSAEELNPPGGKKGVLVNTATPHMAVHKDREDFEKEIPNNRSLSNPKRDDVYLKIK